ncbi:MAG: hypothetical protein P8X81_08450 [Woeseiaceae bacterium]|jgi:hypothetical protein
MKSKSAISVGVAVLLGLSLTCTANAEDEHSNKAITDPIQACVAKIGDRANYDGAERVVHVVSKLEQKNLVEKRIEIETTIYAGESGDKSRAYHVSCITGNLGKVVKLRLEESEAPVQG